jgi:hypothetical protein
MLEYEIKIALPIRQSLGELEQTNQNLLKKIKTKKIEIESVATKREEIMNDIEKILEVSFVYLFICLSLSYH